MSAAIRRSWSIFTSVVGALAFRELKARFGEYRLGVVWAVASPMLQVVAISLLLGARGRQALPGIEFPLFVLTGVIPFGIFAKCLSQGLKAMGANDGLLVYRQIQPFDILATRWLIECIVHIVSFLVLLVGAGIWLGYDIAPADPLGAILALACFVAFCLGILLIAGVVGDALSKDMRKLISLINRPLYLISGVIFPLSAIPREYHSWLDWNPILHALELFRGAWFNAYPVGYGSWPYLAESTLITLAVGCLLYHCNRHALGRGD